MKKTYTLKDLTDPRKKAEFKKHITDMNDLEKSLSNTWKRNYIEFINYVNANFYDVHPKKYELHKLERTRRNINRWVNRLKVSVTDVSDDYTQKQEEDVQSLIKWLERAISDLDENINWVKKQKPEVIPIINRLHQKPFREAESILTAQGYLKAGKWKRTAPELVALILLLKDNRYFKNDVTDIELRNFFIKRYGKDIKDKWQPSRHKLQLKRIFEPILKDVL